jgi:hypothetical protein
MPVILGARHRVIPSLMHRFGGLDSSLARAGRLCALLLEPIRVRRRMDDNLNDPVTIEAFRTIELNAIGV